MPWYDLPLEQLRAYRTGTAEPASLDTWWSARLAAARAVAQPPHVDLIPAALDRLRYVDCALLARRITAECLLSAGLMDTICPPSTVFALSRG